MATRGAPLAKEQATFDAKRAAWVRAGHEGKWMAVVGTKTLGPFRRFGVAWDAAVSKFGETRVLVDRVLRKDRPIVVSWVRRSAKS